MKFTTRFKFVVLFTTLTLCASNAFGMMNWVRSCCGKRMKLETSEIGESKDQQVLASLYAVHDTQKLYPLLYDLLTNLPPELIRIIIDYDHYEFKGMRKKMCEAENVEYRHFKIVELPNNSIVFAKNNFLSKPCDIIFLDCKTDKVIKTIPLAGTPLFFDNNFLLTMTFNFKTRRGEFTWWNCGNDQSQQYHKCDFWTKFTKLASNAYVKYIAGKIITFSDVGHLKTISKESVGFIDPIIKLSEKIFLANVKEPHNWLEFCNFQKGTLLFKVDLSYDFSNIITLSEHLFAGTVQDSNDNWFIEIWYWDTHSARCLKKITLCDRTMEPAAMAKLSNGLLAVGVRAPYCNYYSANEKLIHIYDPVSGEHEEWNQRNADVISALRPLMNGNLVAVTSNYETRLNTVFLLS